MIASCAGVLNNLTSSIIAKVCQLHQIEFYELGNIESPESIVELARNFDVTKIILVNDCSHQEKQLHDECKNVAHSVKKSLPKNISLHLMNNDPEEYYLQNKFSLLKDIHSIRELLKESI